jgi:tellurite resistance protein TehA-like permease
MPAGVRVGLIALAVLLALYAIQLLLEPLQDPLATQVEGVLTNVSMLGAGALCVLRARARREERLAWSLFAAGVLSWGFGDLYYTLAFWGRKDAPSRRWRTWGTSASTRPSTPASSSSSAAVCPG